MFREKDQKLQCRPKDLSEPGWGSLVMDCIGILVSALCFTGAGIHMLSEEFPEITAYSGERIPAEGFFAVMAVVILLFALPGSRFLPCRRLLLILAPVLAVLAAGRVWIAHGEEIRSGSFHAAGVVIAAVNRHYKFNFSLPEGQARYGMPAAVCLCGVLLAVFVYMAFLFRRQWIVMGFPLLILNLGLLAGCAPGLRGITECFIGLLFCQAGGWEGKQAARGGFGKGSRRIGIGAARGLSLALLVLLAVFLPLGIIGRFAGAAEELAKSGEGVVTIQRKMEEVLELNIQQLSFGDADAAKENVNNRTPKYKEQEILRVSLADKPEHTLYLRGFYGGEYAGGGWNSNRGELLGSLDGQDWTEEDVARWLSGQAVTLPEEAEAWEGAAGDCTLQFLRRGSTVYVPYFLAPDDPDGGLRYGGEYQIIKKKSLDTVHFARRKEEPALPAGQEANGVAEWYAAYVQDHYRHGSEAVPSAGRIAEELLGWYGGSYSVVMEDWIYEETAASGARLRLLTEALFSEDTKERDRARLLLAQAVSTYLGSGIYSQELDQVPDGTDVVEYFLSESKTGYCVQYASAGVLILQAMGIPARYASGYVAAASDFRREGGRYVLAVKDSAAHAWAEVYLEGAGWVPVEMTPGYKDEETEGSEETAEAVPPGLVFRKPPEDRTDAERLKRPDEGERTEGSEPSGNTASSDGTEPSGNKEASGLAEPSGTSHTPDAAGGTAAERTEAPGAMGRFVFPGLISAAGMAAVLAFLLRLLSVKKKRGVRSLLCDIRQKRNRQAVLSMNRAMYRRVTVKKGRWPARLSDEEYMRLLIRTFPDTAKTEWEAFIGIARKAGFSRSEISDEEVQTVYKIFHKS